MSNSSTQGAPSPDDVMIHTAGYIPTWAQAIGCDNIAPDFLAIVDALNPETDRLKAAWLIIKYIGKIGIALSLFEAWANQDPDKQTSPDTLQTEWDASCLMTQAEVESWKIPLPIPDTLKPVEPFDFALLPTSIRAWVSDIAERMQCPPDFPAVGAMVALSSVIGRKACIKPKRHDDWRVIPNLWGVVVGRPGLMKSPALGEVMRPVDTLEIEAGKAHDDALSTYQLDERLAGLAKKANESNAQKALKKGNIDEAKRLLLDDDEAGENTKPALKRYKVVNSSMEALGEILMENPQGVLVYRDELSGLLQSFDREDNTEARAFYLQGYDGNQGYIFDRIMRGKNKRIEAVCLSVLGGIQPGKLKSYIRATLNGGHGDDGLLQRFGLLVWPDVSTEWVNVDRWPDTPAKQQAFATFQKLDALEIGIDPETGATFPVEYRFSPEAQNQFDEWRTDFETMLRRNDHHPALESHLSKYRKLIPALALVCSLADGESVVSRESLLRALAWSDYLQSHADRAYAAGCRPATEGASALLAKIKTGHVKCGFSPRDVYLKGWANLTTAEDVQKAANLLCDLHHLKVIEHKPGASGGRPSVTYEINPLSTAGK
jgi:putative DNA primase/helicase